MKLPADELAIAIQVARDSAAKHGDNAPRICWALVELADLLATDLGCGLDEPKAANGEVTWEQMLSAPVTADEAAGIGAAWIRAAMKAKENGNANEG